MNMSAMAGLGVTAANWKYTGPAAAGGRSQRAHHLQRRAGQGHKMQTPNCTATPTSQQVLGATQYIQAVSAAVSKYKNLSAATAAGYIPITTTNYPVVHYLNYKYMNRQDIMNPNTVDSLVYATTPYGPVLVAAMFLMPGQGNGPMPYGCLVQWHAHTNLCTSDVTHQIDGLQPCNAAGSVCRPHHAVHDPRLAGAGGRWAVGHRPLRPPGGGGGDHGPGRRTGTHNDGDPAGYGYQCGEQRLSATAPTRWTPSAHRALTSRTGLTP
jgi:hypothetical protein